MAGLHLRIDVTERQALDALGRLVAAGERPRPALIQIGEHLIGSHEDRIKNQVAPDGQHWAPLSPDYLASKKKRSSRGANLILVLNGYLASTFRYSASEDELVFGTDRQQAAALHFGAPSRKLPARPFMGLSSGDEDAITTIVSEYLERSFKGG